ncbi:MAG: M20 family metallopeptidase [Bowdeniella nasicola]|nr:M20 family metallopeptidase [Bowdeniella nasicola]
MSSTPQIEEPYDGYVRHVSAELERDVAAAPHPSSSHAPTPPAVRAALTAIVEDLAPELNDLARDLHAHPEVAFAEHRSIRQLATLARRHGVDVEVGCYGLETAGHAIEAAQAGRSVALLSEYDALPELGHACGHNVIAASGLGAYLALHELRRRGIEVPGTIRWIGTPAEEGHSGKEYLARAGAFDGLDAALMVHPYGFDATRQVWLGRRVFRARYTGVSAHASSQPFMGRNALDAASLAYQGLALLRQQILPVDRLHAIITSGGQRASVIADSAELSGYVRSKYPDTLADLSTRVHHVFRGAALMTGCALDFIWDEHPPSLPVRGNAPLEARFAAAMAERGRDLIPSGVLPETIAASTDFGNVSYRVPGIHPLVKISPDSVALHTRAFEEAAGSPAAWRAVADATYALARTAFDVLHDDALAQAVRDEFDADGGAIDAATYFGDVGEL